MRRFTVTTALAFAIFSSASFSNMTASSAEEPNVNIYFWYDYLPAETIAGFEKDTGIKVIYDIFDAVEMLTTKALTGGSGYDLIMPSSSLVAQYAKAGAIQKLDKSKIQNIKDLNPTAMALLAEQDPGNQYAVPYAYGTTGVIYNKTKIAERMKNSPVDSLDMVFKPEIVSKFADCGVAVVDAPEQVMAIALHYLGFDPFSTNAEQLRKVDDLLSSIRPYIRHFKTGSILSEMASGDLCLALGWSGDAIAAAVRAQEAKTGVQVRYAIPREGTNISFDVITVPVDAPHPENAHKLINYLLSPAVAARLTNTTFFPTAVESAKELVDEGTRNNENIYLPDETMKRLFADKPRNLKSLRIVTRIWTKFKTGG